jgi:hypothetical protein
VFAPSRLRLPQLPHVEHLHSDCSLAVFDQISIRHLVRPPLRHTAEERLEAGPHLPELTKGQRFDAPYLRKPLLPWPVCVFLRLFILSIKKYAPPVIICFGGGLLRLGGRVCVCISPC